MKGKPALHNFVAIFADDFFIHSVTVDEHILHVKWVFEKLHEYQCTLSLKKATFAQKKVNFLAHEICAEPELSIRPLRDRCLAISEMAAPKDVPGARRLLGILGYYRRYVQNFSRIATPITALLKDDAEWIWSDECQEAMEKFKTALGETLLDPE